MPDLINRKLTVGTMILVFIVSACGTTSRPVLGQESALESVGGPDTGSTIDSMVASFERWHGTPADRQAAEVATQYAANGAFSECMTKAGYPVDWKLLISRAPEWPALGATRWLRTPMHSTIADPLREGAARQLAMEEDGSEPVSAEQREQEKACRQGLQPDPRVIDEIGWPPGLDELSAEWNEVTSRAAFAVAGSEEDYVRCVQEQSAEKFGIELSGPTFLDMIGSLQDQMSPATPPLGEIPRPGTKTTAAWEAFKLPEDQFLRAAWTCQEPVYAMAASALVPVVDAFNAVHAEEIAELAAHWTKVREEAAIYGWSPEDPYAMLPDNG